MASVTIRSKVTNGKNHPYDWDSVPALMKMLKKVKTWKEFKDEVLPKIKVKLHKHMAGNPSKSYDIYEPVKDIYGRVYKLNSLPIWLIVIDHKGKEYFSTTDKGLNHAVYELGKKVAKLRRKK